MPEASQSTGDSGILTSFVRGDRALNLNRLRLWVVVMLLALAAGRASAQAQANGDAALSARVDLAVEAQQKAKKIPGVSLAVCRDGKIMKARGYGLANVELNVAT